MPENITQSLQICFFFYKHKCNLTAMDEEQALFSCTPAEVLQVNNKVVFSKSKKHTFGTLQIIFPSLLLCNNSMQAAG